MLTFPPSITRAAFRTVLLCLPLLWLNPYSASANTVIVWNANAGRAALAACIAPGDDPLHESRMYAMMHVAIHDALNAIDRRSRPYAFNATALAGVSADAAVAAAARDVLVAAIAEIPAPFPQACRDAGIASVEADYATALSLIPDGPAKTEGIGLGHASAAAIVARRVGDGSIRRSSFPASRKAPSRASGASPMVCRSPLHRSGAMSGRSCCSTPTSSGPQRHTPSPVAPTLLISKQ